MRLSQQMKHLEIINPYDNLSTQMCMDCICDLKMSYKFFMQIKKAQIKLKSILVNLMSTDNAAVSKKSAESESVQPSTATKEHELQSKLGNMHILYQVYYLIKLIFLIFIFYFFYFCCFIFYKMCLLRCTVVINVH